MSEFKLVPVVPTEEMKEAGKGYLGMNTDMPAEVWKDMLEAAPVPEVEPAAWMVPHKFSVSRNGGPYKEEVSYQPWWTANADSYVEDEHGVKHFPYPLYTHPVPGVKP